MSKYMQVKSDGILFFGFAKYFYVSNVRKLDLSEYEKVEMLVLVITSRHP